MINMTETIIDANGAVLGRLASAVAKRLLLSEQIIIVNAEKAVVTGNPDFIKKEFFHRRDIGDPIKGPFYPRYPDKLLRRTIRGMLPYKKEKGKKALNKLKVFVGLPDEFKDKKLEKVGKTIEQLHCKHVTLGDICKQLGAKERWK